MLKLFQKYIDILHSTPLNNLINKIIKKQYSRFMVLI